MKNSFVLQIAALSNEARTMKINRSTHTSQVKKALKQRLLSPTEEKIEKYLAESIALTRLDGFTCRMQVIADQADCYRETASILTTKLQERGLFKKKHTRISRTQSTPNTFTFGTEIRHLTDKYPVIIWAINQEFNAQMLKERSGRDLLTHNYNNEYLYGNTLSQTQNLITSNSRPAGGGSSDNPPSRAGCRGRCFFCLEKGDFMITSYNKQLAQQYGITRYGQVLLSAFPDSVLVDAVHEMKTQIVQNPVTWLFKRGGELCKTREIEPYYEQMLKEVQECGYKPGDKLIITSDPDAQFRYNDPPSLNSRKDYKKLHDISERKPIDMNNPFLARFGVPEWAKENDQPREK